MGWIQVESKAMGFDLTKRDFHLMPIIAEMEKGEEGGLRVVVVGGELFVKVTSGDLCGVLLVVILGGETR